MYPITFLYTKILVFISIKFAIVLMKLKKFHESEEILDKAIKLDHNNNENYKIKGFKMFY